MPSFPGNDISTDKLPEKNPNKAQITSNQTLSMYYIQNYPSYQDKNKKTGKFYDKLFA